MWDVPALGGTGHIRRTRPTREHLVHLTPTQRVRRAAICLLAAGAVVTGLTAGTTGASAAPGDGLTSVDQRPRFADGRYIVILRAPSAAQYDGADGRFTATRPQPGGQLRGDSDAVRAYTQHLRRTHRAVAEDVGAEVARDYTVALNGFAARLTGRQATELLTDRRVLTVVEDEARSVDTWASPEFLGLVGKNGAWGRTGGRKNAGAGTVVGILDTGIWPESASFAGARLNDQKKTKWDIHRIGQRTFMDKADGTRFNGVCQTTEDFLRKHCNTKLIGARYYPDIFNQVPPEERSPEEWMSPRDGDGHGTHTASTAAGNSGVRAVVEGRNMGRISGMAPAARVASYKVCFNDDDPNTGDCYTSASVAAIDDAVADGVDVINYSISGSQTTVIDAVELAFEGAAEAGVFVATSAGNSGPSPETVAHASPWVTTVAASTHVRFENTVVLGNGEKVLGASFADAPVPVTPLVDSTDVADTGVSAEDAALCTDNSLDPAKASGKIVVCTRGVIDRVAKSAEVARAGGRAMILANPSPNSLDADVHSVPTVHVDTPGAETIWDYLDQAGSNATARFRLGNRTGTVTPVPQIAGFSSRGPSLANDADILKPDIAAPGVNVLAAVAPPSGQGRDFDLYSGTSMSSPHIAGLAAFMAGHRPNWTPMKIKSAMMTTARNLLEADGKASKDAFAQGAGNVRPKKFFDPGLFVESTPRQWRGFLTGQGLDTGVDPVAAKDLNQPSMASGQAVGTVSFTRQFLATKKGTWRVSVRMPGFDAKPSSNRIVSSRKGDIEDLTVAFTRTTAPLGEFSTGFVVLTGPTKVRIPVALRPVSLAAPSEVRGTGTDGSVPVEVTSSTTGELDIAEHGLAEADTVSTEVAAGSWDGYCITVAEDSKVLRLDLDAEDDRADLDLYVIKTNDACTVGLYLAGQSATGSADESVTVADPEPGTYYVEVDSYAPAPGQSETAYRLDGYDVNPGTTLGSFRAEPNPLPVQAGQPTTFEARWEGLDPDSRFLGVLEYEGALAPTYVAVDTSTP
jgi:subtilisin family serine protease